MTTNSFEKKPKNNLWLICGFYRAIFSILSLTLIGLYVCFYKSLFYNPFLFVIVTEDYVKI